MKLETADNDCTHRSRCVQCGSIENGIGILINKKTDTMYLLSGLLVPEAGLEPAWYCYRRILSPLRLPVSPLGRLLCYYSVFI